MRRCVGCVESKPKETLYRIAYYEGKLTVDETGRAKGRGVYLCKDKKCFDQALKRKALQRSFKTAIPQNAIEDAFAQLEGLLEDE